MSCLKKYNFKRKFLKFIPIITFLYLVTLAVYVNNHVAKAAKLSDGTWTQSASPGTTTVTYTNTSALDSSSDIVLTFPSTASVDQTGTDITVTGAPGVVRTNNTVDNTITLTIDGTHAAGLAVTITMTDALTSYTTSTYAQESLAINTQDSTDTPVDFGVAIKTNTNTTTVSASVPLFVNLSIDDQTVELGTLSTASVSSAQQTYTVNSNNQSGVQLQITADGDMDDGSGNTINDVGDGAVTAGSEEYGIAVSGTLTADVPFDSGDDAVPQTPTNIASSAAAVSGGTMILTYKASIAGTTVAGDYDQVVTVTVATNS